MKSEITLPNIIFDTNFENEIILNPNILKFYIYLLKYIIKNDEYYIKLNEKNIKLIIKYTGIFRYFIFKKYINILLDYDILTMKKYKDIDCLTAKYLQIKYLNYYRYLNKHFDYSQYAIPEELLMLTQQEIDGRKSNGKTTAPATPSEQEVGENIELIEFERKK